MRKAIENVDLFRGKRATVAAFLISSTAIAGTAAMLLAPNSAAESVHTRNVAVNYSLLPYVALAGTVILLELLVIAVRTSPDTGVEIPSKKPVPPSVKSKSPGKPKKEKPVKGQSKEVAKAAGEMTKKGEGLSWFDKTCGLGDGSGETVKLYSVTINKTYKGGNDWKHTNSLSIEDLPKVGLAANETDKYIKLK